MSGAGTGGTQQSCVGTAGRKFHDGAQAPVREERASAVGVRQLLQARLVDGGESEAVTLIKERRDVRIAEVELVIKVHAIEHDAFGEGVSELQG